MDKKYQLLKSDYIDLVHPDNKQKTVRLYRIISLKDFYIPQFGQIKYSEIGGYVQSEDNLSHDGNCWVTHNGKVFDNAIIMEDAVVKDDAAVYGHAEIKGSSKIKNLARVRGNSKIIDSVISDKTDVKGNAYLYAVIMKNASMIYENAKVENCILYDGTMIHGDSKVNECILKDVSEIRGGEVIYSTLTGRHTITEGFVKNETLHTEIVLEVTSGTGEMRR